MARRASALIRVSDFAYSSAMKLELCCPKMQADFQQITQHFNKEDGGCDCSEAKGRFGNPDNVDNPTCEARSIMKTTTKQDSVWMGD